MDTETEQEFRSLAAADDADAAIAQIRLQMERFHKPRRNWWFSRDCLPVYRAHVDWLGICVLYVQVRRTLHVLRALPVEEAGLFARQRATCLLDYETFYDRRAP